MIKEKLNNYFNAVVENPKEKIAGPIFLGVFTSYLVSNLFSAFGSNIAVDAPTFFSVYFLSIASDVHLANSREPSIPSGPK